MKLSLALLIGMTTSACAGWCDPTSRRVLASH